MDRIAREPRRRWVAWLQAGCAPLLACVLLATPATAAAAGPVNTFQFHCSGLPIEAEWNPPMTVFPNPTTLSATANGGSCSGTVDGKQFENEPLYNHIVIPGNHTCEGGAADGRATGSLAGKAFYATAHYRRVETNGVLILDGDAGGEAVVMLHAQVGIGPGSPLAQLPGMAPFVAPDDAAQAIAACFGSGLRRMHVRGDVMETAPTFSSPAHEPPGAGRPANPAMSGFLPGGRIM